ncbi:6-phospho-beta-glucosidase [Clostridium sp. NCR]|nr:6-phospho-beta-glucosidase [Clostridium sp. NCR]
MDYIFPKDFWWGSASSATQMEGAFDVEGKEKNIWDYWFEIAPEKFHNEIGPSNTSQFYYKYKEDIKLMKELGHNSFRFSISWSRLIKSDGSINEIAVDFYNDVINTLLENEIEPFINLFHFDMPMYLQELGGWENRDVVNRYQNFAKLCFKLFGDRVKNWFTHNEPIVPVECGYLGEYHYPAVVDFKRAVQVGYHIMLSSALAIMEYKKLNLEGQIGIIINLTPSYPRSNSKEDLNASNIADLILNRSFLDPSVHGEFPNELVEFLKSHDLIPVYKNEDLEIIKNNTVDLLGVNYYQPRRVKAKESAKGDILTPESFFDFYDMPGKKINPHRGWEIYEKGIYDLAINIRDNYNNIPFYISENGMGVEGEEKFKINGQINDDYRIEFIKEHLKYVHKAIEEGCNVRGYHLWTFMDNWSWLNSYKNRYGFVEVNINDEYKRSPKKSAYWFKKLIENNGF